MKAIYKTLRYENPKNHIYIFFALTIIINQQLYGQKNDETLILKNKVKSIKEISYEVKNKKKKTEELIAYKLYDINAKLIEEYSKYNSYNYKYEYNANGLLAKKSELDEDKQISNISEYEYDKENKLINEVTHWTDFDGKDTITYQYNSKNQLININHWNNVNEVYKSEQQVFYESGELYEKKHEEKYNKSAFEIQRFDKCGNLIYLYENGEQDSISINYSFLLYCPDLIQKNYLKIDTLFNSAQKIKYINYILQDITRKSIYSYDETGKLLKVLKYQYDQNNKLNQSEEQFYNEKGELIEFKEFSHWQVCNYDSKVYTRYVQYKYEYYSNGLLNKTYSMDKNGKAYKISEYFIEYYN